MTVVEKKAGLCGETWEREIGQRHLFQLVGEQIVHMEPQRQEDGSVEIVQRGSARPATLQEAILWAEIGRLSQLVSEGTDHAHLGTASPPAEG